MYRSMREPMKSVELVCVATMINNTSGLIYRHYGMWLSLQEPVKTFVKEAGVGLG